MEEIINAAYLAGFEPSSDEMDTEKIYSEAIDYLEQLRII